MSPEEQNEILRLLQGDAAAVDQGLKRLYFGMGRDFLRHFVWRGLSAADAQDVLQETVVKIAGAADQAHSSDRAGAWFWKIAKNCLVDHLRKGQGASPTGSEGEVCVKEAFDSEGVSASAIDPNQLDESYRLGSRLPGHSPNREAERCVHDALRGRFSVEMPERAYVLLRWVEGASIRQIADFLGRSEDATKTFLYECRKKAKPFFQPCYDLLEGSGVV